MRWPCGLSVSVFVWGYVRIIFRLLTGGLLLNKTASQVLMSHVKPRDNIKLHRRDTACATKVAARCVRGTGTKEGLGPVEL